MSPLDQTAPDSTPPDPTPPDPTPPDPTPPDPTPPDPTPSEHQLSKTWGVAMITAGLALAVGRYVLLPLQLDPRWLSTVIAGLGGAAIVLGWTTLKKGRDPLQLPLGLLGGAGAAALVLGGLWTLRPATVDDATLVPHTLDAFQIHIPDWVPPEVQQLGSQGRLAVRGGEHGPVLELQWMAGEMASVDEMAGGLALAVGELGPVERRAAPPSEGPLGIVPIETVALPSRDTSTAVAALGCPSGVNIIMSATARAEPEKTAALLDRVVRSIVCAAEVEAGFVRARWTPPEGFVEQPDSGDTLTYGREQPDGTWEALGLPPVTPDPGLVEKMRQNPQLAGAMVASLFPGARPVEAPAARAAHGETRDFYAFEVPDDETGVTIRMMITAWPCPAIGATALAIFMSDLGTPLTRGRELLLEPTCPAP